MPRVINKLLNSCRGVFSHHACSSDVENYPPLAENVAQHLFHEAELIINKLFTN